MEINKQQFFLGAVFGALLTTLTVLALDRLFPVPEQVQLPKNVIEAYNTGIKDALKTNPPSKELEYICLELWSNKQK